MELSDEEKKKLRELAEETGRESGAVTPIEIRTRMGWTARQWYTRKHLVFAMGIKVTAASEMAKRKKDAARGAVNFRVLATALYTELKEEIWDKHKRRAVIMIRAYGASPIDAETIYRIVTKETDAESNEYRMLVMALCIPWKRWSEFLEERRKAYEEKREEREKAEAEHRKETEAERDKELEELASGKGA